VIWHLEWRVRRKCGVTLVLTLQPQTARKILGFGAHVQQRFGMRFCDLHVGPLAAS
jgi:hypothetical protein